MMEKDSKQEVSSIEEDFFINKAIQHMCTYHTSFAELEPEEARSFIIQCKKEAFEQYRLFSEIAVMTFILVCWTLMDSVENIPELDKLLRDFSKSDNERAAKLYEEVKKMLGNSIL